MERFRRMMITSNAKMSLMIVPLVVVLVSILDYH
jgi:hypothetical protein